MPPSPRRWPGCCTARLLGAGFTFSYPDLAGALTAELQAA
jgi:hypothetical protein